MVVINGFCSRVIRGVGVLASISLLWLGLVGPVHAYLDPGTGSILLQGLIAGVAAVAAAGSVFWHRIKSALGLSSLKPTSPEPDTEPKPDE